MGCPEGRSSNEWINFDFYGHKIVTHLVVSMEAPDAGGNAGDGHHVPVPHFPRHPGDEGLAGARRNAANSSPPRRATMRQFVQLA
jgi:hypothetical protein